ncbi:MULTISPECIES: type-F conjugative transfer system pilin assembly thiol-disulfide isomerase TrbB [Vibrio]|uniref:type-F conjugative transfer system pilin assembly thiol-disulfide isomerase TrbB n=1 Tax=Vibrio TaxID=662 RepID=UPI0003637714|nr:MULTISPECIES: type-F conjugative transfer system pilin assembly thiol-disulfide isomerase TrbB [Vibrio]OCH57664.1 type-F conjugative transfer system pilin assembly thiol-disulfide isomerase TrbB [Vibrio lentus]PMI46403.1 type-F conjugative transfer system pilin assembly thiol-disulfide isomerase TrbB [Vibrio lentus]
MLLRTITVFFLLMSSFTPLQAAPNDDYAMVFFFRSDCPYCHRFAPKLKNVTERQQLQTYAFSLDGQSIPHYPVPIPATPEISQMFFENPRSITVPATFLINVNSQKFVRVSIGDVTANQLETSVRRILSDPETLEAIR